MYYLDMMFASEEKPSESTRLLASLEAAKGLVDIGVSVAAACRRSGISRSSYYRLLGLNEKALSSEQEQGQDRQRMDVGAAINADSTTIPA